MIYDSIIDLLKLLFGTIEFLKPYATTVGVLFLILRQNNIRKVINGQLPRRFRDTHESDMQEMRQDIKDIKVHLGVESSNLQQNGSKTTPTQLYARFFSLLQAIAKTKRRNPMLTNLFKTSVSKKLTALILGAAVAFLNKKLGLDLTPEELLAFLLVVGSYIIGQSHVDGKKAQAVVTALKTSVVIDPNAKYRDSFSTIKEVHAKINEFLKLAEKNDVNILAVYPKLLDLIHSFEYPEPVQNAVLLDDEQVSA